MKQDRKLKWKLHQRRYSPGNQKACGWIMNQSGRGYMKENNTASWDRVSVDVSGSQHSRLSEMFKFQCKNLKMKSQSKWSKWRCILKKNKLKLLIDPRARQHCCAAPFWFFPVFFQTKLRRWRQKSLSIHPISLHILFVSVIIITPVETIQQQDAKDRSCDPSSSFVLVKNIFSRKKIWSKKNFDQLFVEKRILNSASKLRPSPSSRRNNNSGDVHCYSCDLWHLTWGWVEGWRGGVGFLQPHTQPCYFRTQPHVCTVVVGQEGKQIKPLN